MKLQTALLLLCAGWLAWADGPLTLTWDATPGATYEVWSAPKSAFKRRTVGTNTIATLAVGNSVTNYYFVVATRPGYEPQFTQVFAVKTTKPKK